MEPPAARDTVLSDPSLLVGEKVMLPGSTGTGMGSLLGLWGRGPWAIAVCSSLGQLGPSGAAVHDSGAAHHHQSTHTHTRRWLGSTMPATRLGAHGAVSARPAARASGCPRRPFRPFQPITAARRQRPGSWGGAGHRRTGVPPLGRHHLTSWGGGRTCSDQSRRRPLACLHPTSPPCTRRERNRRARNAALTSWQTDCLA